MAGKAAQAAAALGAARGEPVIDIETLTAQVPPRVTTQFKTVTIRTHAHDEERDDETGEITRGAAVELEFVGPAILMPGSIAIGGEAYRTELGPDFAVQFLEEALAEARRVAASRKEPPLKLEGLAATPADMAAAAAAADAVEQLKNGQSG